MKNSTPRIDRDKKTIYATKSFLIKAGQFGTTEFNTLNDMLKTFSGYKVEEEKIARNASKEVYGDLTYKVMKQFIENYETDDIKRKAMLEEYETIKTVYKWDATPPPLLVPRTFSSSQYASHTASRAYLLVFAKTVAAGCCMGALLCSRIAAERIGRWERCAAGKQAFQVVPALR